MAAPPAQNSVVMSDDPGLRLALRVIMGRCGFEVAAEVEGVAQAVAATQLLNPDAIVVDVALSGFGGLAGLVPALKAGIRPRSVFILSAPAFSGLRPRALQLGALDLFDFSDLRPLERALHRVGTMQAGCTCWLSEGYTQPEAAPDI